MSEWDRIYFVQERDGMPAAREFVKRTLAKYAECLRKKGLNGAKPHHASFPQYRRGFVESCVAFRDYLRKTRWVDHGMDGFTLAPHGSDMNNDA